MTQNDQSGGRLTKAWSEPDFNARWRAEYHPCDDGVHVFQPEGGEFGGLTLKNYPDVHSLDVFRRLSSAGEGDDFDLICDLFVEGSVIEDCCIRRQDLDVIDRALTPEVDGDN